MCFICGKSPANSGSRLGDGTHWALGDVGLPLLLINQRMGQMQMKDFSPGTTKGSFPYERGRASKGVPSIIGKNLNTILIAEINML